MVVGKLVSLGHFLRASIEHLIKRITGGGPLNASELCDFFYFKAFLNQCYAWFLLNVNPKPRFLDVPNIPKATKIKINVSPKNLMIDQRKLMFLRKYCLWTWFITQCSEFDLFIITTAVTGFMQLCFNRLFVQMSFIKLITWHRKV